MRNVFLILALTASALAGADFDAVAFYGQAYFRPHADKPFRGTLSASLDGDRAPHFVELNNSDEGAAPMRFEFTSTGAVLKPASEGASCELGLDLGATECSATIAVVELDVRASVGFHIVPLADGPELMLAVTRGAHATTLRISKRGRNGMATLAATEVAPDFRQANTLAIRLEGGLASVSFAGVSVEHKERIESFSIGVAASDGRSRVSNLSVEATFDPVWAADAQSRLRARQALVRLREYCTEGLLAGVLSCEHPSQKGDLAAYSADEKQARLDALSGRDFLQRFSVLSALAKAKPKSALAGYEAGTSALLAGNSRAAREYLDASLALRETGLARLVLAEASRRLRDFVFAQKCLDLAAKDIPSEISPDLELMRARLMAARGELTSAHDTLNAARARWPNHEPLRLFAESARELASPQTLVLSKVRGPGGLLLVTDLDDVTNNKLTARLAPYMERVRHWLPGLAERLDGTIAIYANPSDYLRAALLVAGDSIDNVAGMFLPTGFGGKKCIIACRAFGEDELVRTLAHELWHLAVSTTDAAPMAPWLNEGMAVYISAGIWRDGLMSYRALPSEFGGITAELASSLAGQDIAARALAAGHDRFYIPADQHLNYAVSWALVWFLAENDMASARTLRELISGNAESHKALTDGLAQLVPRVAKALKDRKLLP